MRKTTRHRFRLPTLLTAASVAVCFFSAPLSHAGDELIELSNGDRYHGQLISVSATNVLLKSEVHGLMSLPRSMVHRITFQPPQGLVGPTAKEEPTSAKTAVTGENLPQMLENGIDPELLNSVREQLLGSAGPEAQQTFNQMVRDLMMGQLSIGDLRDQAQQALQDMEKVKHDLGPEAETLLEGYGSILRSFIEETAPNEPPPAAE